MFFVLQEDIHRIFQHKHRERELTAAALRITVQYNVSLTAYMNKCIKRNTHCLIDHKVDCIKLMQQLAGSFLFSHNLTVGPKWPSSHQNNLRIRQSNLMAT